MGDSHKYDGCMVLGAAIKYTGDLLRPVLAERRDLLAYIDTINTEEDMMRFHPLPKLMEFFEIAKANQYVKLLAKAWAINVVRQIRKQSSVSTPLKALRAIEAGFPMQHKGDVGEFKIEEICDNTVRVLDSTYAPCGYIITFAEQVVANYGGIDIAVEHLSKGCKDKGRSSCQYTLAWEESELLQLLKRQDTTV